MLYLFMHIGKRKWNNEDMDRRDVMLHMKVTISCLIVETESESFRTRNFRRNLKR